MSSFDVKGAYQEGKDCVLPMLNLMLVIINGSYYLIPMFVTVLK